MVIGIEIDIVIDIDIDEGVVYVCSKSRRGSSGIYEKDEKLSEKEKELMEKDAEVASAIFFEYQGGILRGAKEPGGAWRISPPKGFFVPLVYGNLTFREA